MHLPDTPGSAVALDRVRACVIGPDIPHRQSLLVMLEALAISACSADDSHTFRSRRGPDLRSRFVRGMDLAFGTRDQDYLDYVLAEIDRSSADVLIFYWGTLPLADIVAIKRLRPRLKTMLMLLCYPLSLSTAGIVRQWAVLQRAMPSIDALICPTAEMQDYLERNLLGGRRRPLIGVVAPCWPDSMCPSVRSEDIADQPNLVYVGRTDLSGRTVHKADDIRGLMHGVLDAGIELHHAYSPETDDGHPRRKQFKPLSVGDLMAVMSGFDASLVAYNTDACRRTDRFDLTVPDRLLSSVLAGVPIALPADGYAASRSYLCDYAAVLTFSSPEDLHRQLADREQISRLKDVAWKSRRRYVAERQAGALGGLVAAMLARRKSCSGAMARGEAG